MIKEQTATHVAWTREDWLAYADRLLAGAMEWASPTCARITPPGAEGGYGYDVDGLEGFARTFLLAGFRITGARGVGVDHLIDFYTRGIIAGVDPENPERWVRLDEHDQAKVEAASLALILDMTRPWIWEKLDVLTQQRVIDYLAPVVGDATYPPTNWLWFRVVVQTFLRSVGGPWSVQDIKDDLALHDSLQRADGWISDGPERSYDHYVGWALHLYPVLWTAMHGARELAGDRIDRDVKALDRFLQDAVTLIGADGSPLIQGRSLIYRFAAAAPFWAGVIAEVPSVSAGVLRTAAERIIRHFEDHNVPNQQGVLSMGWHDEWRPLAQSYSGPGSPYWAVKGLLGVSLPADHPVWHVPAEPLPVEEHDELRTVRSAGWIISGTAADGIVRIVNHGTDHAADGVLVGDSPLYARIGYSTATAPLLDDQAYEQPLEQSVSLVNASGDATHRAAMELLDTRVDGPVGVSAATWQAHWLDPRWTPQRHGSGLSGETTVAGRLTVNSLVRGPWEVRVIDVNALEASEPLTLRIGGWALSGTNPTGDATGATARTALAELTSETRGLVANHTGRVETRRDASPLGTHSAVPILETPAVQGATVAALISLTGAGTPAATHTPALTITHSGDQRAADILWPDGVRTTTPLTESRIAGQAKR